MVLSGVFKFLHILRAFSILPECIISFKLKTSVSFFFEAFEITSKRSTTRYILINNNNAIGYMIGPPFIISSIKEISVTVISGVVEAV